jgi:DNA-binding FadR family transcriptional regulator
MSRLHRVLLRELLAELAVGAIPEGGMLARESDLAERFQVSRGVVRESLRGLEERGVIRVKHGAGATVQPRSQWNVLDPDVLSAALESEASAPVLTEVLECRRIIEIEAAALAAERATEDALNEITHAYVEMERYAELATTSALHEERYHEANVAFHQAIVRGAQNRVLSRLTEPIQQALTLARAPIAHQELRQSKTLPEHYEILQAIAERDPARARAAMEAHLHSVATYLDEYTHHPHGQSASDRHLNAIT